MLRKECMLQPTSWGIAYQGTLWAYRLSYKEATGYSPFQLVYGILPIEPFEFLHGSPKIAFMQEKKNCDVFQRIRALHKVEEIRLLATKQLIETQMKRKEAHDRHLWNNNIEANMLVLLHRPNIHNQLKGKWLPHWEGPYRVKTMLNWGAVELETLKGEALPLVNISRLKAYHQAN
ncbi:hypothetical protein KP509_39G001300 [Ceratopteris richardii]|uniref:Uncharacterized protein n=1 Tax=Ceratopteris richardii TaxID=49495 RepID=A0A8T2PY30_CERRI|nr:hypothetical protein KP509_39G001300 [Ceratopteris richardii]